MIKPLIFHIDMNSFFASCEQAIKPELKGKPLIVGGDPERRSGIVLAASYEAKRKGVKTTMPLQQALQLCPEAIIIKSTYGLYSKMSKEVMTIFDRFTPLKEQASIDEAYLEMTGTEHLFGNATQAAILIQNTLLKELDLPSSVGISTNKLLAKMASEMKKPMGVTTLFPDEIVVKMWPLNVGDLYGIGKKTTPKLESMNIHTIGELAKTPYPLLSQVFGTSMAQYMLESANGRGSQVISSETETPKSIGNEMTFVKDMSQLTDIEKELFLLSDHVAYRLRRHGLKGKTVSIKLKDNQFKVITRGKTLEGPTDDTIIIYECARQLLAENLVKPIRLLGLTLSHFNEPDGQLSLFSPKETPTNKAEIAMDQIREKYGYNAVQRASILDKKRPKQ